MSFPWDALMRYLWLVGLLIACGSALALALLPVEVFLLPGLLALVLGLALFAAGMFLRQRQQKADIGAAMRCFAEANGGAFQDALPADQLPAQISLFRSGDRQRCTNAIALRCADRPCLLFRFECYYRRGAGGMGSWRDYHVAYVPRALPGVADFGVGRGFAPRGLFVGVVMFSLLIAVGSLVGFGVSGAPAVLVQGLWGSAGFLVFGSFVVLLAGWRSHPTRCPDFLDEQILGFFSRQGLCAECVAGNLAVWTQPTIERLWHTGWNRSFCPVNDWIAEELQGLLEGVRQVLSSLGEDKKSVAARSELTSG